MTGFEGNLMELKRDRKVGLVGNWVEIIEVNVLNFFGEATFREFHVFHKWGVQTVYKQDTSSVVEEASCLMRARCWRQNLTHKVVEL